MGIREFPAYAQKVTKLLNFPSEVNDTSARIVATGAVAMAAGYAVTGWAWLLLPLTYGFIARVMSGPTFSPLARLATQVITPRLSGNHKIVPGPPKRFAQGIGALFSVTASVLFLVDLPVASRWVAAALAGPAFLEAAFGFCVGCKMFAGLMKVGVIPESVCLECSDISSRLRTQGVIQ